MSSTPFIALPCALAASCLLFGCSKPRGPEITMADVELTNAPAAVATSMVRFEARPGSKMAIEGTANMIHPRWFVESTIIGGFVEAGANFPAAPGQSVTAGKVVAKAEAFIPVRSLKSVEDGKPYSDRMDDIMYEKFLATDDPKARITFRLTELVLKEPAQGPEAPHLLEAKGDLTVAGVTKPIQMPVRVLPMPDKKLKVSGSTAVKMTDYKIEPPAPAVLGGMLKTGDDVKLSFEWFVAQKSPSVVSNSTAATR
jgi:polyisoprenoid-binding protein YceI